MIPKVIHYCWFGNKPLDNMALKCIESWKKFFPDYEIVEWNESNFDLNCCRYVKEAYLSEKWAFVSDYARFWIIYNYGGIYFDTDVEVIKDMNTIIERGAFFGTERSSKLYAEVSINPGLGMGAEPKNAFYKEVIENYHSSAFISEDGSYNFETVVERVTSLFRLKGYKEKNEIQIINDITVYPSEYFCPLDYSTGILAKTDNSYAIHWFNASWLDEKMSKRRETSLIIQNSIKGEFGRLLSILYIKCSYYIELLTSGNVNIIMKKINHKLKKIKKK